jgi:tRNA(Ile)-lysidine synthase
MSLSARVLRTVRRQDLLPPGGRVVVALSGGPDSVALVHLLRELELAGDVKIAGVAHFNHQLRGAQADGDEEFCREMSAALALPFECGRGDVRAAAAKEGRSIEDAARVLRYAFLEGATDRLAADAIAVGHSRDDQAETFLLRLLRGSGPQGLAGILPRAGRVIRPLLEISRADLRAYVSERHLPFREDATNADVSIPRNRVRHELLPHLERDFSPGVVRILAREATIARQDEDLLHGMAIDLARSIVLTREDDSPSSEIDAAALTSLHPALAARVTRLALQAQAPQAFIGFDHVDRFLEFARQGGAGGALSLPGQQAVRTGARILLGPEPARRPRAAGAAKTGFANSFTFPLSIPGEVRLDKQGWAISAVSADSALEKWAEAAPGGPGTGREAAVVVAAGPLSLPLSIRSRRPGDRFHPTGLGHRQKLQDFLVNRKIPRELRDSLPLVVDAQDRIVWVVGQAVAADFRVTEGSRGVLLLKSRRLGGLG